MEDIAQKPLKTIASRLQDDILSQNTAHNRSRSGISRRQSATAWCKP
jgi:hypothetical protein